MWLHVSCLCNNDCRDVLIICAGDVDYGEFQALGCAQVFAAVLIGALFRFKVKGKISLPFRNKSCFPFWMHLSAVFLPPSDRSDLLRVWQRLQTNLTCPQEPFSSDLQSTPRSWVRSRSDPDRSRFYLFPLQHNQTKQVWKQLKIEILGVCSRTQRMEAVFPSCCYGSIMFYQL